MVTIVSRVGSFLITMLLFSCFDRSTVAQEIPQKSSVKSVEDDCGVSKMPQILPGSVVMLVGDSLAVGMQDRFKSLATANGYVPAIHAVNGTSIFQWSDWVKKDLALHRPSLMIVSLGTNDAVIYDKVGRNPGVYRKFVEIVEASGVKIVWIGPPNISRTRIPKIEETRKIIKESVPLLFESERYETPRGGDGVHSSMIGYSKWMESVWAWMISKNIVSDIPQ
jgi:lysophospholipase L1-like esterase